MWLRVLLCSLVSELQGFPFLIFCVFSPLWQHLNCRQHFPGPAPRRKTGMSVVREVVLASSSSVSVSSPKQS